MTAKLIVSNLSRHYEFDLLMNGSVVAKVFPLQTDTIEVQPGQYELAFASHEHDEIPHACKPIQITFQDGTTARLKVQAEHFSIDIYDHLDTHINAKRGFLCGHIAHGVHVDNAIT